MIVSDLPTEIASTDQAFASAISPKKFKDITLEPYSLLRQMVAVEICGDNPHSITAVIVHMWVCTLSPDEVLKNRQDRPKALVQAFNWAEEHGVRHPGSPEMDELIQLYSQINQELQASTQLMPANNGREPKNDGRLPG